MGRGVLLVQNLRKFLFLGNQFTKGGPLNATSSKTYCACIFSSKKLNDCLVDSNCADGHKPQEQEYSTHHYYSRYKSILKSKSNKLRDK